MDPIVEQAGVAVGLQPRQLRKMLPTELTLWIDPEEVAYRIGENGSICVLYDSASRASPSSDLESTGSGGEEFVMERVGNKKLPDLTDGQLMDFLENKATVLLSSPHPSSSKGGPERLNHSVSSSSEESSNSQSPPLSPLRYQHQQIRMRPSQQQQMQQQQQQHLFNNNNIINGGRDNFVDAGCMYQWEGFSNSQQHQQQHLKVRGQC